MDKSIAAVFMGFIIWFLLSFSSGILFALIFLPGVRSQLPAIATRFVGDALVIIVGGWATAERAPHSPLTHALVVGVIIGFLGIGWSMPYGIGHWQFLAAAALALFGGWISSLRRPSVEGG